jgi:hypothetical protein
VSTFIIDWRGNIVACPWLRSPAGRWAFAMAVSRRARIQSHEIRKMGIILDVRVIREAP